MLSETVDFDGLRTRIGEEVVFHRNFIAARQSLVEALKAENLVWLVGPAGVGKGTLMQELTKELNLPVEADPRLLGAVAVRAPSAHGTVYPWKALYTAGLEGLADPLPQQKIDHAKRVHSLRTGSGILTRRGSVDDLRRAFFSAVKDRGVKVVFIDEALNLLVNEMGRAFRYQIDILRDLSDEVGCKIVLVGTPRILDALEHFGLGGKRSFEEGLTCEIIRRMGMRYFHRYGLAEDSWRKDSQAHEKLVRELCRKLPEGFRPELSRDNLLALQLDSVGCAGLLVAWFLRAISSCETENGECLTWGHFEKTALSDAELKVLEKQCQNGEAKFARLSGRSGCGLYRRVDAGPEGEGTDKNTGIPPPKFGKGAGKGKGYRGRVGIPAPRRPRVGREGK